MTQGKFLKTTTAALGLALGIGLPAAAQSTDADRQFLHDILQVTSSVSAETAREARAKCAAYLERVETMTGISPVQRLYFEAEIDFCISYAMHRGSFSDETGDECSYHYSYATKLAQVIKDGRGQPGFGGDLMQVLGDRLRTATKMGPGSGCTADYGVFEPFIAMAAEEAAKPPPDAPFQLWDEIAAAERSIAPENAREVQKACLALSAKIDAVPDRPAAERLFYEGLIENCVAHAMASGNYSDESGDVCTHHYRYAQKFAEGAAAGKNDPRYADYLAIVMRGELGIAKRQGPQMGCQQDYESLNAE